MNCKNLRYRTKKGIKYAYCLLNKKVLKSYDDCCHCSAKEYNPIKAINKVSKKHAKQEKARYSVIVPANDKCSICGSKLHLEKHEIFCGTNRTNSIKNGFVLYLCRDCHMHITNDRKLQLKYMKIAQKYFEKNIGSREYFIKIFHKSYL